MKYLRFEKAVVSVIYITIVKEAELRLEDHGTFIKDEVIRRVGYDAIGDDIRWDYVRLIIERTHDTELIPLAPSFMKRHKKEEELRFTEKFIARGNGRRTIGYANACPQNGHFVIHRLKTKLKTAEGFTKSADRTRKIGVRIGAIKDETLVPIEACSHEAT